MIQRSNRTGTWFFLNLFSTTDCGIGHADISAYPEIFTNSPDVVHAWYPHQPFSGILVMDKASTVNEMHGGNINQKEYLTWSNTAGDAS